MGWRSKSTAQILFYKNFKISEKNVGPASNYVSYIESLTTIKVFMQWEWVCEQAHFYPVFIYVVYM